MNELTQELTQRIAEAGQDTGWVEKLRAAATWEEYETLLGEKDIAAPAELKEAFAARRAGKTGKLEDSELEEVTGGWTNKFECPGAYDYVLCRLTFCPHIKVETVYKLGKLNITKTHCDLGYWVHW